jgi:L-fucose mutarotase/ribose pyranase (RbsD/FucU family)
VLAHAGGRPSGTRKSRSSPNSAPSSPSREGPQFKLASLERFAFYERAKHSFAILSTSERRLYGNVILKKGVIRPD